MLYDKVAKTIYKINKISYLLINKNIIIKIFKLLFYKIYLFDYGFKIIYFKNKAF